MGLMQAETTCFRSFRFSVASLSVYFMHRTAERIVAGFAAFAAVTRGAIMRAQQLFAVSAHDPHEGHPWSAYRTVALTRTARQLVPARLGGGTRSPGRSDFLAAARR
jgi:hypothetical protein